MDETRENVKSAAKDAVETIKSFSEGVANNIKSASEGAAENIKSVAEDAVNNIKTVADESAQAIRIAASRTIKNFVAPSKEPETDMVAVGIGLLIVGGFSAFVVYQAYKYFIPETGPLEDEIKENKKKMSHIPKYPKYQRDV